MMIEDAIYLKEMGITKESYQPACISHRCRICGKVEQGYVKKTTSLPHEEDEELYICKGCYDELADN